MIIAGEWRRRGAAGPLRPVLLARVVAANGRAVERYFLVDSGGDRTVFCRETLDALGGSGMAGSEAALQGIGGTSATVMVEAAIEFTKEDGNPAQVAGPYPAFVEASEDEEDILGRDVTNNFVSITDYPNRRVLLIHGSHSYAITGPAS